MKYREKKYNRATSLRLYLKHMTSREMPSKNCHCCKAKIRRNIHTRDGPKLLILVWYLCNQQCNMPKNCMKKNTFFVYTPLYKVLCNSKERLEIYPKQPYPQSTDLSSRLCIFETPQFRQEQYQQIVFMAAQCSSFSQNVLYIWRTFSMIWISQAHECIAMQLSAIIKLRTT